MNELDLLKTLKPTWLEKSAETLARGSGLRDHLREQLDQFYSFLEQSVESGDPAWLDTILVTWAGSLTQSDLEGKNCNLIQFINELMLLTFRICREELSDSQAMCLMSAVNPCFAYAYEKAARSELEAKVAFISTKLEQTQQSLERIDRSKSDFISVAAHELKTPLTLIEGYASMLRDTGQRTPTAQQDLILLDGIQKGTDRMQAIVNDMIDVSLIDNNLMKLNFQPVWIDRLFAVLLGELTPVINERKQSLTVEDFPGSSEVTYADPERLLQVFRNLLLNAVKYTPDGGKIQVHGRSLPGFLEIIITDTGIGISPEDQPYIFEKFSQIRDISLHSSSKTKFKGGGPGLGLKIARGIIEAHGGAIWVESPCYDENNCPGSTFHILLPQRTSPPDEKMARIFAPIFNKHTQEDL